MEKKEITAKDIKALKSYIEKTINWLSMWRSAVLFEVTHYCENNCPHCHSECSTKHNLSNHMPETDIYHYIDELNKDNCTQVDFAGGEITCVEDVNPGFTKRIVDKRFQKGAQTVV